MNPRYAPMFAPYTLNNGVAIKNRFVVAPLTIYESDANGGLTDAARNFWRDRFRGFGLFVMPFTNVHPTGISVFRRSTLLTQATYPPCANTQPFRTNKARKSSPKSPTRAAVPIR
ncbi:hypothetical protein ACTHRY_06850 [Neisseria sp. P0004.S004]|jgi:hypothetical protein|uniref:oxidoreductase n=1 Tax=Neisseria TaxID=482 RepID=UPI000B215632|nr:MULTISPECIES: hypothetical protein [Neisseria]